MSTANHRCTSCRKPVHVRGSMCKTCRAVSGTSARDVTPLRDVGPREPPCAVYVRTHDVRAEGDPWFPEGHDIARNAELRAIAAMICDQCPVFDACATARRKRDVGIWAGAEWERPGNETRATLRVEPVKAPRKPRVPREINHGTQAGYMAHRKRAEQPCDGCRHARNAYIRDWKTSRKQQVAS